MNGGSLNLNSGLSTGTGTAGNINFNLSTVGTAYSSIYNDSNNTTFGMNTLY